MTRVLAPKEINLANYFFNRKRSLRFLGKIILTQELLTQANHQSVLCLVTHLGPTLFDPMDCSPPGSSVHGDSPGKNTGMGCHALLHGIFPTVESHPGRLHCRQIIYSLSHQRSPSSDKKLQTKIFSYVEKPTWINAAGHNKSFSSTEQINR